MEIFGTRQTNICGFIRMFDTGIVWFWLVFKREHFIAASFVDGAGQFAFFCRNGTGLCWNRKWMEEQNMLRWMRSVCIVMKITDSHFSISQENKLFPRAHLSNFSGILYSNEGCLFEYFNNAILIQYFSQTDELRYAQHIIYLNSNWNCLFRALFRVVFNHFWHILTIFNYFELISGISMAKIARYVRVFPSRDTFECFFSDRLVLINSSVFLFKYCIHNVIRFTSIFKKIVPVAVRLHNICACKMLISHRRRCCRRRKSEQKRWKTMALSLHVVSIPFAGRFCLFRPRCRSDV